MRALSLAFLVLSLASLAAQNDGAKPEDAKPSATLDPKVAAVLAELDAKVDALTSYRMTMETTSSSSYMPGMSTEMKANSVAEWKRVGESYRYRADTQMNSKMVMPEATTEDNTTSIMVVDGKFSWTESVMAGQTTVMKSKMGDEMISRPSTIVDNSSTDTEVTLGKDKEVAGATCAMIEFKVKAQEGGAVEGSYSMAFDRATGLMREHIVRDAEGKEQSHTTITKVELGIEIPDARFTYTPPEGAMVMDLTTSDSPK